MARRKLLVAAVLAALACTAAAAEATNKPAANKNASVVAKNPAAKNASKNASGAKNAAKNAKNGAKNGSKNAAANASGARNAAAGVAKKGGAVPVSSSVVLFYDSEFEPFYGQPISQCSLLLRRAKEQGSTQVSVNEREVFRGARERSAARRRPSGLSVERELFPL